jgi:hypothetical protein
MVIAQQTYFDIQAIVKLVDKGRPIPVDQAILAAKAFSDAISTDESMPWFSHKIVNATNAWAMIRPRVKNILPNETSALVGVRTYQSGEQGVILLLAGQQLSLSCLNKAIKLINEFEENPGNVSYHVIELRGELLFEPLTQ